MKSAHHNKTDSVGFYLYEASRVLRFIEVKVEWCLPMDGGREQPRAI